MSRRIFFKLMLVFVAVIAVAAVTLDFSVRRAWQQALQEQITRDLGQKAALFANRVETDRSHSLADIAAQEAHAAGARATVIDPTGRVLADSEASVIPEGQQDLPEFRSALAGKIGSDERENPQLHIPTIYVAAPISGGAVRFAYPISETETSTSRLRMALGWGTALALGFALLVAVVASRYTASRLKRIVGFAEQVAAGDLSARIAEPSVDEVGQVASALDKTARRLEESFSRVQTSQRELETVLNSIQDAVIAVGPDGLVQWANRSLDRLLLQPPRLNAPVVETVRDPDFLATIRRASQSQVVTTGRANSILPGHTFEVTAAPMPQGGAVAVLRDLTENERMEKTRRDFIANVSHELRTPLTSIQGYTETLLDGMTESNHVRDFLEVIRKNATRMGRLTEDLLTLARVESGEQRFDLEPVSPAELLSDARESFQEMARVYGVEIIVESTAPQQVRADREAVHQIFANLMENALKYAANGKRVVLGARADKGNVEFYVRDYGPGIASEDLPRLFERFYRVDKARSRESGGTGLGLAIAKHIVMAHDGTIRAESELNHGCTFLFTLPNAAA